MISSLIALWSEKILDMISIFSNLPRLISVIAFLSFVWFCVLDRLVMFPSLGEVAYIEDGLWEPSSTLPSGHQSYML